MKVRASVRPMYDSSRIDRRQEGARVLRGNPKHGQG